MKDKLNILYEDNHLLVVEKPINVLSQADDTKDLDMLTILKKYIKDKYNKPGDVYLGLVHRLDRPTGGIMVFARTSKAAARLSKQIKENKFSKKYLAVVKGTLKEKEGRLINYISKNGTKSFIVTELLGKKAILDYKVISEKEDLSLVEVTLQTGRYHQIRVQFSNIGHPLYGDQKYGANDKEQLALYAYYLSFYHPITNELMQFELLPKYGIFNKMVDQNVF